MMNMMNMMKQAQNIQKRLMEAQEELVNMIRKKRESGKDSFELIAEKANKLHDDRAYCACMASYALMCERRKNITSKKKSQEMNYNQVFKIRTPKRTRSF